MVEENSKSAKTCPHYDRCGGCSIQHLDYEEQLSHKQEKLKKIYKRSSLEKVQIPNIKASPSIYEYRNKMEFSFGDLELGGELQLGMHPRGRMFDVVTVDHCFLVDDDFRKILKTVLEYCRRRNFKKYHIKRKTGFLRHLVLRKGINTGEILVNLVTTSSRNHNFKKLAKKLENIDYRGELVGFLQTINDNLADAVECDDLITHRGRNFFYEKLLGKKFKITPFSFFQTNTKGAEILFDTVQNMLTNSSEKTVFDLYAGTGTISRLIAPKVNKVIGIELMKEAVEMAQENSAMDECENCEFIQGDVLAKLDELHQKPEIIIIDPPRPGIHPEALHKIIAAGAREIIYVSCKPETQARDLEEFTRENYEIEDLKAIDMFPHTEHIEVITHLIKKEL